MVTNVQKIAAHRARGALFVALVAVAGCRSPAPSSPTANASQSRPPDTAAAPRAGAQVLQVDASQTVVTVIVRRAGSLAKLGHDHVITSADETGTVWLGNSPADSSFELTLPVARFDVDLPEARAAAGVEFAAPIPEDARQGTRRNMLRTEVLDGEHFPSITLRAASAHGAWPQPFVRVAVTLKGVEREQEIPVIVERTADRVSARGELRLNQSDFGMTPFSVAGGAIQVADMLEIRFVLVAAAAQGAITPPPAP